MSLSERKILIFGAAAILFAAVIFFGVWLGRLYQKPYRDVVRESGAEESLVYAVMKAESGFREDAESPAGALGLMQLMPSTAEFICQRNGLSFYPEKMKEGAYNVRLGCLYLLYLEERFSEIGTVLAAYNAGEGVVSRWLSDPEFSDDGIVLKKIPYPETAQYVKKVERFRKNYLFFHD